MLRLFPERLHIGIGQSYLAFALMRGKHVVDFRFHECQTDSTFNLQFSQLQGWLQQLQRPGIAAHVFLAADTAHLTLLPWRDEITEPQQQVEVARAYFRQQWPDTTEPPEVRVSSHGYGRSWLVTALDRSVMHRLQSMTSLQRIKLQSIEPLGPYLAQSQRVMKSDGWLAIAEHQSILLVYYAGQVPQLLRSLPLYEVERTGLPALLQRESRLAGLEQASLLMQIPQHQSASVQHKHSWLYLAGVA